MGDDFDNKSLSAAALNGSGIVTTAELNIHALISGGNVMLHPLIDSGLVSLVMVIDEGFVTAADLAPTVVGRTTQRVLDTNVIEMALLEDNSLIVGVDNDQVKLNGTGSLLSVGIAELIELVSTRVVDPSYLDAAATVDKDDLVDTGLVSVFNLVNAGLIGVSDLATTAIDLEEMLSTGVLDQDTLNDLDQLIALGLLTSAEVDGFGDIDKGTLVTSGLVTNNELVSAGLLGTHVDLVSFLSSGLVTIDQLKDEGLDDRSGRVELAGLLAVGPSLVTLAQLEAEGLVRTEIVLSDLLQSGLVDLIDLVDDSINKTALLAAIGTITENDLITAGLFDPAVDISKLIASGLVTVQNLVDASLISANIESSELIALNLVTGQQLVSTGLITQVQLDTQTFPAISIVSLLNVLLVPMDNSTHLITIADLTANGFFSPNIVRSDLIATGLVTGIQLDAEGLTCDPVNPRLLIASGLVTPDDLAAEGFILVTVDKNDLSAPAFIAATGVTITENQLVGAGLLPGAI